MDDYSIRLPEFQGPLDLLLQMIERAELDITRVSLAAVADQYLDFITRPGAIELTELADYLVIAAKLILYKSRMLLPRAEADSLDPVEDSAEALARQLREYKQFKQIALLLRQREQRGLQAFPHRTPAPRPPAPRTTRVAGLSFNALYNALRRTVEQNPSLPAGTVLEPLRVSIHHRIERIRQLTAESGRVSFSLLLGEAGTRIEVVVTFLAVLESLKRKLIAAEQDDLFGEIFLKRRDTSDETVPTLEELESDFG